MKIIQFVGACALLISAFASADTLRIAVSGLQAGEGNLRIAVFSELMGDQFPEGTHLYGVDLPVGRNEMTVAIEGVEPGKYAVSAYQDSNQNQQLDRDADNIPTERYGFSVFVGDGESTLGEALFDTNSDGYDVSIELK